MLNLTASHIIWDISMISVAVLAAWRGGWAERTVAFGMVIDSVVALLLQNHDWKAPQWADLGVDTVYLIVMLWVAFKSNRRWPLWTAGFQIIDVAIYLAFMVDGHIDAWATYTAITIWSYLILIAIVVGILTPPRPPATAAPVARSTP